MSFSNNNLILLFLVLVCSRVWLYFGNLFNGDKALGEGTNKFLNENWMEILKELRPVLNKAIGEISKGIISPIFAKFPYDQMFL